MHARAQFAPVDVSMQRSRELEHVFDRGARVQIDPSFVAPSLLLILTLSIFAAMNVFEIANNARMHACLHFANEHPTIL